MEETVFSLEELKTATDRCTRCGLSRDATQAVVGEGPRGAAVMFIGEQPGNDEDLVGRPFVGPAGRILDQALAEAGIDRGRIYVTNAVKHFKFTRRGKRRLHQRPNSEEIQICRWWLEREQDLIGPTMLVALGATAARSILGHEQAIAPARGRTFRLRHGISARITVHPSSLLRIPDEDARHAAFVLFVRDLHRVAELIPEIRAGAGRRG